MYKSLAIILVFMLLIPAVIVKAQSKYAVIVGINDYYETPTKKSPYSLKGCVNDAMSIKYLLMNRFGFSAKNIDLLTNQLATQQNLINALDRALNRSKAGDAVVFYYSGHGTFIDNPSLDDDLIKRGYNQSLIMSDLFAKNYGCLVKDNRLKKLFNNFVAKKVILTSIFDCCFSGGMAAFSDESGENPYSDEPDSYQINMFNDTAAKKVMGISAIIPSEVSFDMNEDLRQQDDEKVPRPAEIPNSKFATLAASSSFVKAAETWDESGVPHGAFTKALLNIYEQNKTDIRLSELIDQLQNQISRIQLFLQYPEAHYDPNRKFTNLIGLPLNVKPSTPIVAQCINVDGATITINIGYRNGVAIGNKFASKGSQTTIDKIFADSATGKLTNGVLVNKGQRFTLVDHYRSSQPLLKIFINASSLNTREYSKVFNAEVLPLTELKNYRHYSDWKKDPASPSFLLTLRSPGEGKQILTKVNNQSFYVFLPIPADIATKITMMLAKEQSVKLVTSPTEADRVLYLNYCVDNKNNSSNFIFNYRAPLNYIGYDAFKFTIYKASTTSLMMNNESTNTLLMSIKQATYQLVRSKSTHWLNTYVKQE